MFPISLVAQDTWTYSLGAHVEHTIPSEAYTNVDVNMTTASPENITFQWELISNSMPSEWVATLCDYTDCYTEIPANGTMDPISAGDMSSGIEGYLKITCNPGTTYGTGVVEFYVYDQADYNRGDTISFTLHNVNSLSTPEETLEFSVFPNPTEDFVNVSNQNNEVLSYGLFNIAGSQVLNGTVAALESEKIDLSALPKGIYFLDVKLDSGLNKTEKIIVK